MFKKVLRVKLNLLLAVIASLIVLQLITAYVFGFIIQKEKQRQFDYFIGKSPVIKVVHREYYRGFFSSDVNVELALNSDTMARVLKVLPGSESTVLAGDNTYILKYSTHIQHGLFSGVLHGNFLPILSYATINIEYSDNVKNVLKKFFNGKVPLEITDVTYLNQSGKIMAHSPRFDYEEAVSGVKVTWGGMEANFGYNKEFTQFNNSLIIPDLRLSAPTKGEMLLNGVTYASDTQYSKNQIKVGSTRLSVTKAKIEWKDKIALSFKLGDVLKMVTGIDSAEFLNGLDVINPSSFTFNNIVYEAQSSDDGKYFNARAGIQFASLVTNGSTFGPLNVDLAVNHVNAPAFSKLADDIESFSASYMAKVEDPNKKDEFIQVLKTDFVPILMESPVVSLSKFELKTPNGLIRIAAQATTQDFTADDINDQDKFMNKLLINLNFSLPKPVVSYLFVLQMKYLLSAGNAELDSQSSEALTKVVNILLDNQINTWTKKGYLKVNNGMLESHLVMRGGKLIINDTPAK